MGDGNYQYPVALKWDEDPGSLKKLKNKLLLHFQIRNQVLQKKPHELKLPDGRVLQLNVQLPEAQNAQSDTTPTGAHSSAAVCKADKQKEDPVIVKAEHGEKTTTGSRSSRVLIENVQDSCSADLLNLLVEKVSERDVDTDFYLEIIPELKSAVITFTCDIDVQGGFIGQFSNNPKVRQHNLRVKCLEESRMIRAEGLTPNTSEEMIGLYFENPKYGGGSIERVEMIADLGAALITFESEEVVKFVLKKYHIINKKAISVFPYYPSIGECLYGKKPPLVESPHSVEFPLNLYLMEFFSNNAKIKQDIECQLENHHCEVRWPAPDCQKPVVRLSFPHELLAQYRKMAKIAPTWNKKVHDEFSGLMSKYEVRDCDVKNVVWEVLKEKLSSSMYNRIFFKADMAAEKVFLVGLLEDLIKTESSFKDLVDKTTNELMRVEDAVSIEPDVYKFLYTSHLERSLQKDSLNLKMEYDSTTRKVILCGTEAEVQNAKCKILSAKQDLKFRAVNQDPRIIQFLLAADKQKLSSIIFTRNNINAMMEVRKSDVLLMASSEKDIAEAEKQMKNDLACRRISLKDRRVIQTPEWDNLKKTVTTQLNVEMMTVAIEALLAEAVSEVVISGLFSSVQTAHQQIHQFLKENTEVKVDIVVKSRAVMKFFEDEKILDTIKDNVNVSKKNNIISLSGPEQRVQNEEKQLRSILSKLHYETLYIDKPGAKKFCIENEEQHTNNMWLKYSCVICLQKDGDGEAAALEMNLKEPHCHVMLPNGVKIAVYKDNPYHHKVDVAVIAASDDLKPIGRLVESLLNDAVRAECEFVIQEEKKLEAGDSIITNAGNLPCKQLIHAVSPKWDKKSSSKSERQLRKAIKSGLDQAAEKGHSSIAISASSFVACEYPVDICTECIVTSIKQHMENQQGTSSIRYIHLVDSKDDIVKAFTHFLSEEYEEKNINFSSKQEKKKMKSQKDQKKVDAANKFDAQMVTTKEGIKIKMIQGNIQDATTNMIVNSVGKDLDLQSGAVSSAIFRSAGTKLQDLLNKVKPQTPVTDGCVFITDSCNLPCDLVIHCVVPQWDEGKGSSEQILRKIVNDCLQAAEENHMPSISFPAMGTGVLRFPKNTVAALMYEECLNFSSKGNHGHPKEVTFMLHPSDTETIKAFSTELEKKTKDATSQKKSDKSQSLFGTVTSPSASIHELKIGSITYQVKMGDITKEDTDVIVNSTNKTFNLKTGVSKKILEEAGKSIEDECASLGATQPKKPFVVTKGGNLSCRNIIHIEGGQNPSQIKKCVTDALTECERLQAASVAFPAIGTGAGNVPSAVVSDAMLDAVVDFVSSKSAKSLQTVKVVIFQPALLQDFCDSMKKKEHKTSVFTWLYRMINPTSNKVEDEETKVFELRDNIEPVIYHLCAENKEAVRNTSSWLQDLILRQQLEKLITDDWILEFGDKERESIADLQKTLHVTVNIDFPSNTIKVSGLTEDVVNLTDQIQDMIKKVREKKTKEREAELCSNLVEWRYYDGNNFVPFDQMTNLELEKAKSKRTLSLNIDLAGVNYTVVMELSSMQDPTGKEMAIQRFPKHENTLVLPKYWDSMDKSQLKVVTVDTRSPEYSDVQAQFVKTCQMKVIKIERIQNLHLYQNYQIKKQSIDTKNGTTNNEMQLFHGTDENTVKSVNSNGYNRSYSGLNVGALLGNGTYFAVDSNYSAHDQYSKPDANGRKYMYLARVLTGEFCVGQQGMVAPPAKNPSNSTDLYDSVTNDLAKPSVFVIFNDIQAYPEYLITFSK
ncbi:protein mono-ADP-ribosyltransferase PARP14-like [Eleutherodactylus coqui]|uniref:protein mono-ADP-ribosyltransferase PARP14-like n=1 Tax=Eleutherodactylus coqui TaxID=57060 RepID=UPI00346185C4